MVLGPQGPGRVGRRRFICASDPVHAFGERGLLRSGVAGRCASPVCAVRAAVRACAGAPIRLRCAAIRAVWLHLRHAYGLEPLPTRGATARGSPPRGSSHAGAAGMRQASCNARRPHNPRRFATLTRCLLLRAQRRADHRAGPHGAEGRARVSSRRWRAARSPRASSPPAVTVISRRTASTTPPRRIRRCSRPGSCACASGCAARWWSSRATSGDVFSFARPAEIRDEGTGEVNVWTVVGPTEARPRASCRWNAARPSRSIATRRCLTIKVAGRRWTASTTSEWRTRRLTIAAHGVIAVTGLRAYLRANPQALVLLVICVRPGPGHVRRRADLDRRLGQHDDRRLLLGRDPRPAAADRGASAPGERPRAALRALSAPWTAARLRDSGARGRGSERAARTPSRGAARS